MQDRGYSLYEKTLGADLALLKSMGSFIIYLNWVKLQKTNKQKTVAKKLICFCKKFFVVKQVVWALVNLQTKNFSTSTEFFCISHKSWKQNSGCLSLSFQNWWCKSGTVLMICRASDYSRNSSHRAKSGLDLLPNAVLLQKNIEEQLASYRMCMACKIPKRMESSNCWLCLCFKGALATWISYWFFKNHFIYSPIEIVHPDLKCMLKTWRARDSGQLKT